MNTKLWLTGSRLGTGAASQHLLPNRAASSNTWQHLPAVHAAASTSAKSHLHPPSHLWACQVPGTTHMCLPQLPPRKAQPTSTGRSESRSAHYYYNYNFNHQPVTSTTILHQYPSSQRLHPTPPVNDGLSAQQGKTTAKAALDSVTKYSILGCSLYRVRRLGSRLQRTCTF